MLGEGTRGWRSRSGFSRVGIYLLLPVSSAELLISQKRREERREKERERKGERNGIREREGAD
jgi:hypothetical protein